MHASQEEKEMKPSSCSWLVRRFFSSKSPPSPPPENGGDEAKATQKKRTPGGWKAMPFILGNETCERLAAMGMVANFMVFLLKEFHMDQVMATNVINIWMGVTNFAPLVGAYISDAHLGRFTTIAYATFSALMGMMMMTIIAWLPQLRPPPCKVQPHQCTGPTKPQLSVLAVALGFLAIGSGGIRPCSVPFGVDQFDALTEEGRRGINSFLNWYYMSFTVVMIIVFTLVVYIQDSVSWVLGFGLPTALMLLAIVLFFVGTNFYVYVLPEGSVFTSIFQVIAAAYKKRKMRIPDPDTGVYFDPPPLKGSVVTKLALTNKLRCFNKAALITEGEVGVDGSNCKPWRLCSVQKVEETKCLIKIIPIWASGIVCFTAIVQQGTFTLSQALTMNRRLGPKFEIPAGSLAVISMVTVALWLPVYDRIMVPSLRKVTRVEGGMSLLHRMGIGMVFSILSMVVAGLVERMRRASALAHGQPDGSTPMTVLWLAPQLVLMGFAEAFNIIGQIEFYNKEFPENMSSLANSLFSCTMAGASYISAALVNILHNTTGGHGHPDWLTKDINKGRVENLYFLIAGLGVMNLGYFVWVARGYQYKSKIRIDDDEDREYDVQLVKKETQQSIV
ncbi:protein NRT1/ PTR FAMILY 2.13-like isoform X2 [Salvia splendens]|uniref:protein NRT1/ PTR FAMILY 2.13-like isoform X2 n=1 Tax=Salvia splendens TaxID=180675 RepID=UPI001C27893E|nr:protein NRT1/ PTR FAMILY 2.13-like isoform X2 [Salvia splendens]